GGYGRTQLLLASDIDLMVLQKPRTKPEINKQLESFLTFLWDFGLEVGHSVRTTKDCHKEAKNDITIMTNIMESRLLCGNEKLYDEMRRLTSPKKIWPQKKYFEAKLEEQKIRHNKYSDSEHKLEPNVKESPGGLRDIQMISWVAKRHFDNLSLSGLVEHKFLTRKEYKILKTGRNFLWRIRFALHMTTNRREDRLLFEFQRNVAELLGFKNKDNKGIEEFMKLYFKTVREMNRLNEMLLQHFEEEIIFSKRREKITSINSRFQNRNNFIEVVNKNVFKRYPYALLEIFLLLQQHPKIRGVRASTIRLIRNHLHLIDDDFRKDIRTRSLFLEIIRQPKQVGHKLRQMHRYGVLAAYMPVFAKIEGLMQFDLFHVFTVDEHILTVVQNMRLFGLDEYKDRFPVCHSIIKKLPKLELLYLAGLFHDIAKGRGGDHSKLGAIDAIEFCKLHQLSDYDSKLVAWLVEKHLLMSKTAQREDIDDPDIIINFADNVRDQNHLNYLHVLTVADICGTNPDLWNSWKATLMTNLYQRTLQELRRGKEKPILINELIKDTKRETLESFKNSKFDDTTILNLWKTLGNDYFLRHQPDEISWHTEGILKHKDHSTPLVMVENFNSRGGCLIFLYMRDRKNIFSTTTRAIERLGLNVLDARIITNKKDYTLDTFVVLENDGELVKTKERKKEIKDMILNNLDSSSGLPDKAKWFEKRQLKSFTLPTKVNFTIDNKNNRTIMEVSTMDRPGVLSRIGLAMDMCGARLQGAKIATYGERVEDIFYLRTNDNKAIDDKLKFECLENSIVETLS
ncbi:MAG: [protein-PII] uridylyltransferase, partial [Proteobacteria bacterium]|nr:[protein-PII] uridylyltransferase [Pseudomonadota bacterium]